MKKSFVFGVFLFSLMCVNARADHGKKVNERVMDTFRKEFVKAEEVQWETFGELVKATFTMNDQALNAYFQNDGAMVCVTRNISSSQLPIHLLTSLKNNYSDFWIVDLFEMYSNGATSYYITLHSKDGELVLTARMDENWEIYKTK